eukprot:593730-Pleurochrysis_carterae.AAC.1
MAEAREQLAGKRLGCWCAADTPCLCRCLTAVANCSAEELAVMAIDGRVSAAATAELATFSFPLTSLDE